MTAQACLFRVTLDPTIFRDIEIPGDASLYALALAINEAYGFAFDHAFGFYRPASRDWLAATVKYELFADIGEADGPDSLSVEDTDVADAFTAPGDAMTFLFDYGDEWLFDVRLLETRPAGRSRKAKVVRSEGVAPPQYDWGEMEEG